MEAKVVVQAGTTPNLQSEMEQATARANNAAIRAETAAENIEALNTPYVEEVTAYGVQWDINNSDPKVTRIGNLSLHRTLPIQNRMKGCILNDDGDVVKYLNPSDWTQEVRDGSLGQIMVEIPEHYRKFVTIGDKRQVWLSEYPLSGYHKVNKMYVSAYEASLDRNTNKLSSVVNTSTQFRGGNNNADWDETYRSLLGRPVTGKMLSEYLQFAKKRNTSKALEKGSWSCYMYQVQKTLTWLFVVEYATFNSQLQINSSLSSEGYKQGGLGSGISTDFDIYSFNNYNPYVPCGYSDFLGNSSNIGDNREVYNLYGEDGSLLQSDKVARYRGVENIFGHMWKLIHGVLLRNNDAIFDGENYSGYYLCDDPLKLSNNIDTNYRIAGYKDIYSEGFIKDILFGEEGDILTKSIGGTSSTYLCDYTRHEKQTTLNVLSFCGFATYYQKAGLFMNDMRYDISYSTSYVSTRLCFITK